MEFFSVPPARWVKVTGPLSGRTRDVGEHHRKSFGGKKLFIAANAFFWPVSLLKKINSETDFLPLRL